MMRLNLRIKKRMMTETLHKFLICAIALLTANLFFMASALGQTTMAHLGLNNNYNFDINVVGGTTSESGLAFSNSSTPCEGTYHAYCTGTGDYLQLNFNTTGFSSISISWQQKWSTTGTNRGNWILSGDADNNGSYEYSNTIADVTATCFTVNVVLPSSFDNKSLVHLRIQSNVTSGNYLLLDDIVVSGCTPPATPTAGNNGPICTGSTLNLSTPTVSGAIYSWTGPNSFTSPLQNPSITNATIAANGIYSVTIATACCTSGAGTITATVNPLPVSSVPDQTNITCFAAADGTITVAASGGTGPYTFSVDNGAHFLTPAPPTATSLLFTGLLPNTAYVIKVKDAKTCISK